MKSDATAEITDLIAKSLSDDNFSEILRAVAVGFARYSDEVRESIGGRLQNPRSQCALDALDVAVWISGKCENSSSEEAG